MFFPIPFFFLSSQWLNWTCSISYILIKCKSALSFLFLFLCCSDPWFCFTGWRGSPCFECDWIGCQHSWWGVVLICQIPAKDEQTSKASIRCRGTSQISLLFQAVPCLIFQFPNTAIIHNDLIVMTLRGGNEV